MRVFASCCVLVAGCGRIGFDETGPGTTGSGSAAVALAAGAGFSCSVRDGAVWCWGRSDARQLGIATDAPQPTPVQAVIPARAVSVAANEVGACAIEDEGGVWCWGNGLPPAQIAGLPHPAKKLALGGGHACALLDDASIWCWGDNGSGQDGVDPATSDVVGMPVAALASASDVAAGIDFTCAVKTDSSVWCWGANNLGTLGDGTGTSRFMPAVVPGVTATSIAAGGEHACALAGGAFRCWGNNGEGECGAGLPDPQLFSPAPVSADMGFVTLTAGNYTTCAIDDHGAAFCWGNGNNGEQGDGQRYDHGTPAALGVTEVVAIAQGDAQGCLQHSDGTVACWGYGSHGELGDGRIAALAPRKVSIPASAMFITAGKYHACAMVAGGATWCWGSNSAGELGVADPTNPQGSSLTPIQVPIGAANGVWAGDESTCALVSGNIVCWGRNDQGQAGSLPLEYTHPPTMVAGLTANNAASCSGEGYACTSNTGGLYCWGVDDYGQLGDGGGAGGATPVNVGTGLQPTCGDTFGCARIAGGVGCWGYNSDGQLGLGSQDASVHTLTALPNMTQYLSVSAGDNHVCAIRGTTGAVDCWGKGDQGQLGDGAMMTEAQPVAVPGLANESSIATGGNTTCVSGGSTVECWGDNDVGQVGDGTMLGRATPTATPIDGFQVAVGESFACAITTASEVWCWGDNADGQIGSGPQTRSLVPVNVAFP